MTRSAMTTYLWLQLTRAHNILCYLQAAYSLFKIRFLAETRELIRIQRCKSPVLKYDLFYGYEIHRCSIIICIFCCSVWIFLILLFKLLSLIIEYVILRLSIVLSLRVHWYFIRRDFLYFAMSATHLVVEVVYICGRLLLSRAPCP